MGENKFKAIRNIISVDKITEHLHVLKVVLPFYVNYINPSLNNKLSETVCYKKQNVEFELMFKKVNSVYIHNHKHINTDHIGKNIFILDDIIFYKKYFTTNVNDMKNISNSARNIIFEYVKKNVPIPNSTTDKNIDFNNITSKLIGDISYALPSIVDLNIRDVKHRKLKIQSVIDF